MSDSDDATRIERWKAYKSKAKALCGIGEFAKSIQYYQKAYRLFPNESVTRRIEKIKAHMFELEENGSGDDENDMTPVTDDFKLFTNLYKQLYPYQIEGIKWMWSLHKKRKGGILGDDMGLGKTVQVIAFLAGLADCDQMKSAIIIMPVSLISNWESEFEKWAPGIQIETYHGTSKPQKEKALKKVQNRGGVLLTSYGLLVTSSEQFSHKHGHSFVWDYVILDEGHKIKNPTKTTKAAHEISAKHRLVLTGTPIQNNLKELWALYDFCHQGTLLGSLQTFNMQYANPITRSREKDATMGEKRLGKEIADNLRKRIEPYFLRRTKEQTLQELKENNDPSRSLKQKNDFVIWLYISEVQTKLYEDFLQLDQIKALMNSSRSPLVALTVLKKICDHPRLLSQRTCAQLGLNGSMTEQEIEDMMEDEATTMASIDVPDQVLINESGKLQVLLDLLENLKEEKHRTLLFSTSRKMLDIVNKILTNRNWLVLRLDGTVTKMEERKRRIDVFQNSDRYPIFLLTTQVGGVGLTLTTADRVVIYDPSWNPATDSQAVDRAYRIGQRKNVVVYRLMTCGTIEEKIYRRQVFKDSITRQATCSKVESADPHRYFTSSELRDLFVLDDLTFSSTQAQLEIMHGGERKTYPELDRHINFLRSLKMFGISDHDLLFKNVPNEPQEESDLNKTRDKIYIESVVSRAEQLLKAESEVTEKIVSGAYVKPYTLSIPGAKVKKPFKVVPNLFQVEPSKPVSSFNNSYTDSNEDNLNNSAVIDIDDEFPSTSEPKATRQFENNSRNVLTEIPSRENIKIQERSDIVVISDDEEMSTNESPIREKIEKNAEKNVSQLKDLLSSYTIEDDDDDKSYTIDGDDDDKSYTVDGHDDDDNDKSYTTGDRNDKSHAVHDSDKSYTIEDDDDDKSYTIDGNDDDKSYSVDGHDDDNDKSYAVQDDDENETSMHHFEKSIKFLNTSLSGMKLNALNSSSATTINLNKSSAATSYRKSPSLFSDHSSLNEKSPNSSWVRDRRFDPSSEKDIPETDDEDLASGVNEERNDFNFSDHMKAWSATNNSRRRSICARRSMVIKEIESSSEDESSENLKENLLHKLQKTSVIGFSESFDSDQSVISQPKKRNRAQVLYDSDDD